MRILAGQRPPAADPADVMIDSQLAAQHRLRPAVLGAGLAIIALAPLALMFPVAWRVAGPQPSAVRPSRAGALEAHDWLLCWEGPAR